MPCNHFRWQSLEQSTCFVFLHSNDVDIKNYLHLRPNCTIKVTTMTPTINAENCPHTACPVHKEQDKSNLANYHPRNQPKKCTHWYSYLVLLPNIIVFAGKIKIGHYFCQIWQFIIPKFNLSYWPNVWYLMKLKWGQIEMFNQYFLSLVMHLTERVCCFSEQNERIISIVYSIKLYHRYIWPHNVR